jgi:DNA-binding NarL/FixJ family response regulator
MMVRSAAARIPGGAPIRTFVVEGQALIAKALHSFLNRSSVVCMVGDAPALRIEDLERTRPDLIIYGLDNAAQDVSAALATARSVVPNVRFCVLSSFADPAVMQRSIASGADSFVVKDATPSEFDFALRALASGASYVDPRLAAGTRKQRGRCAAVRAPITDLTEREAEILGLIIRGCSNKEISEKLTLTEKTIKNHNNRIFSKLQVTSRTQAAVYAMKAGFAERPEKSA